MIISSQEKRKRTVKIQLEPNIVNLITSKEQDVTKAVHEALNLWLKERLTVCPITNQFCINPNNPCNDCELTKK
jgi:hypothetical protein